MNNIILLNKSKSKKSINENSSLAIPLIGSERLLPIDPITATLSEIDVYNSEREKSSKIRLTVQVNPICSNVLFNNITEIIKDEGTDKVKCLNYGLNEKDLSNVMFKDKSCFTNEERSLNAIRDTQLNNNSNGFLYHCGIDIFNNHYLRSKTFKTICPISKKKSDNNFNTISDFMRSYDGEQIKGYSDNKICKENGKADLNMHVYLNEEILSYKEAVSNKLIEENGWFGFTNSGKIKVYDDKELYDYDWFQCINNRKPCDFIDLYPERDLFYFEPKYNSFRKRIEKNWNYCLTYPSSSTTENIEFIKKLPNNKTSLKAMYFDDSIKGFNGTEEIRIYSVSKHGLFKNDLVNVYSNNDLIYKNAKVTKIYDDYSFNIYSEGMNISSKWLNIESMKETGIYNGKEYIIENRKIFNYDNKKYYIIDGKKVNIDDSTQNISFSKVINGEQVDYYVRIFSKIPNWKFSKIKPSLSLIENNKEDMEVYQNVNNDFDNHIGKLSFSKNVYNDNIAEIIFTDDIDISNLVDNLGRPLTDIYFTILKNNEGYREWYGKGDNEINILSKNIEYSHCFGKLTCGFKLSEYSMCNDAYNNLLLINNVSTEDKFKGLDVSLINKKRANINGIDSDEIQYNYYKNNDIEYFGDINYYGDLCCYSKTMCDEYIIQDIGYRFNTAQRELTNNFKASSFINSIYYDEIINDDYDSDNTFKVEKEEIKDASIRKEGYYYNPHNKINVNSFSDNINTIYPNFIKIKSISLDDNIYIATSLNKISLSNGEILYIYDKINNKLLKAKIVNDENLSFKVNMRTFAFKINDGGIDITKLSYYMFYKLPKNTPKYASFYNDGSCRYIWRDLIKNGSDSSSEVEEYPFTNGCFYINKNFNLYLRRQDPNCSLKDIKSEFYPYGISSSKMSFEKENKYYNENEIEC